MKALALALLFSFSISASAQTDLYTKVTEEACKRFDTTKIKSFEAFESCFQKALHSNADLLIKVVLEKYNDTSYEAGYKFGKELMEKAIVEMIFSCNSYYKVIDSLRYEGLKNVDTTSITKLLSNMTKTSVNERNAEFFTKRGMYYFQLGKMDSASKDFDSAIQHDANALQPQFFKAWALELKGNYTEALRLYENVAKFTGDNKFLMFAAIAKRKQAE